MSDSTASLDWFDTLGFPLPFLDVNEVMDMVQDHFEQLPMGEMLSPGPVVTGQVKGDPLLNQILAVMACMKHLGKSLTSLLEEKTRIAAEAAKTMSQLKGPMVMYNARYLAQVLTNAYSNPSVPFLPFTLHKHADGRGEKHEEVLLQKFPHGPECLLEKPSVILDLAGHIIVWYLPDAISLWIQVPWLVILDALSGMESHTLVITLLTLANMMMTSGIDFLWLICLGQSHRPT
ncbi:hypothetical protein BDR04DRAFT_1116395 [Suillus decipiens]|nr:hypothetical protein BDR04DRAFT_1116395 [Suillus decipiens]